MRDDQDPPNAWAGYLIRATHRPGWSVARLARESGVGVSSLWRWIGGDARVTLESVRQIAEALGDTRGAIAAMADLLDGTDTSTRRERRGDPESERYVAELLETIRDPATPRPVKEQLKALLAGAAGLAESSAPDRGKRSSA